jgi:hypothetical protein
MPLGQEYDKSLVNAQAVQDRKDEEYINAQNNQNRININDALSLTEAIKPNNTNIVDSGYKQNSYLHEILNNNFDSKKEVEKPKQVTPKKNENGDESFATALKSAGSAAYNVYKGAAESAIEGFGKLPRLVRNNDIVLDKAKDGFLLATGQISPIEYEIRENKNDIKIYQNDIEDFDLKEKSDLYKIIRKPLDYMADNSEEIFQNTVGNGVDKAVDALGIKYNKSKTAEDAGNEVGKIVTNVFNKISGSDQNSEIDYSKISGLIENPMVGAEVVANSLSQLLAMKKTGVTTAVVADVMGNTKDDIEKIEQETGKKMSNFDKSKLLSENLTYGLGEIAVDKAMVGGKTTAGATKDAIKKMFGKSAKKTTKKGSLVAKTAKVAGAVALDAGIEGGAEGVHIVTREKALEEQKNGNSISFKDSYNKSIGKKDTREELQKSIGEGALMGVAGAHSMKGANAVAKALSTSGDKTKNKIDKNIEEIKSRKNYDNQLIKIKKDINNASSEEEKQSLIKKGREIFAEASSVHKDFTSHKSDFGLNEKKSIEEHKNSLKDLKIEDIKNISDQELIDYQKKIKEYDTAVQENFDNKTKEHNGNIPDEVWNNELTPINNDFEKANELFNALDAEKKKRIKNKKKNYHDKMNSEDISIEEKKKESSKIVSEISDSIEFGSRPENEDESTTNTTSEIDELFKIISDDKNLNGEETTPEDIKKVVFDDKHTALYNKLKDVKDKLSDKGIDYYSKKAIKTIMNLSGHYGLAKVTNDNAKKENQIDHAWNSLNNVVSSLNNAKTKEVLDRKKEEASWYIELLEGRMEQKIPANIFKKIDDASISDSAKQNKSNIDDLKNRKKIMEKGIDDAKKSGKTPDEYKGLLKRLSEINKEIESLNPSKDTNSNETVKNEPIEAQETAKITQQETSSNYETAKNNIVNAMAQTTDPIILGQLAAALVSIESNKNATSIPDTKGKKEKVEGKVKEDKKINNNKKMDKKSSQDKKNGGSHSLADYSTYPKDGSETEKTRWLHKNDLKSFNLLNNRVSNDKLTRAEALAEIENKNNISNSKKTEEDSPVIPTVKKKEDELSNDIKESPTKHLKRINSDIVTFLDGSTKKTINSIDELMEISKEFNEIMNDKDNEYSKHLQSFLDLWNDLKNSGIPFNPVELEFIKSIDNGNLGDYNPESRKIRIVTSKKTSAYPIKIFLHEYVHAITMEGIRSDNKIKAKIKELMDKASHLKSDPRMAYAFTNEEEFMAEVVSNQLFQKKLSEIPSIGKSKIQELLDIFKNLLKKVKAKDESLLTDSLQIILDINNANKQEEITKKELPKTKTTNAIDSSFGEAASNSWKSLGIDNINYMLRDAIANIKDNIDSFDPIKNLLDKNSEFISWFEKTSRVGDFAKNGIPKNNEDLSFMIHNPDGSLHKTASQIITLSALDWLNNNFYSMNYRDKDQIRNWGVNKWSAIGKYRRSGVNISLLANDLGNQIMDNLDIPKNTDTDTYQKLKMSLALRSLSAMIDMGILEAVSFDPKDIAKDMNMKDEDAARFANVLHIRTIQNSKKIDSIKSSIKNFKEESGKSLSSLFKIDYSKEISDKPFKVENKIKKSVQSIPKTYKELLEKVQNIPWKANTKKLKLAMKLGENNFKKIGGYIDKSVIDKGHKLLKDSREGKNLSLDNDFRKVQEHWTETRNNPFYLKYNIWKNLRLGIDSVINPLGSKMHRYIFEPDGLYNSTITKENRDKYKIAVLQGLGYKVDKDSNVLDNWTEAMEKWKPLVDLFKDNDSKPSDFDKYLNDDYFPEGYHTLEVINSLVHEFRPRANFDTNLAIEGDATTQGTAIGTLQSPVDGNDVETLSQVGILVNDEDYKDYPEYKTKTNKNDPYEYGATYLKRFLERNFDDLSSFMNIIGVSEFSPAKLRSLFKDPVMTTRYGAGTVGASMGMAESSLTSLIEKIEKANDNELKEIKQDLSNLIEMARIIKEDYIYENYEPSEVDEALKKNDKKAEFKQKQLNKNLNTFLDNHAQETIAEIYAPVLREWMDDNFKYSNDFKKAILTVVQYHALEAKKIIEQKVKEYKKDNQISHITSKDLDFIIEENKDIIPKFMSVYTENTDDAIMPYDKNSIQNKDLSVSSNFVFEKKKQIISSNSRTEKVGSKAFKASPREPAIDFGFNAPLVGLIQSIDSSIILDTNMNNDVWTVHDAFYSSIDNMSSVGSDMNKHTLLNNEKYNLIGSIFNEVKRLGYDTEIANKAIKTSEKETGFPLSDDIKNMIKDLEVHVEFNESSKKALFNQDMQVLNVALPDSKYTNIKMGSMIDDNKARENILSYDEVTKDNIDDVYDFVDAYSTETLDESISSHYQDIMNNIIKPALDVISNINIREKDGKSIGNFIKNSSGKHINIDIGNSIHNKTDQTPQEVLMHELVHSATYFMDLPENFNEKKRLEWLYREVKKKVSKNDFINMMNTNDFKLPEEYESAEEFYDYVFGGKAKGNELHEFMAYGLTNPALIKYLKDLDIKVRPDIKFDGDILKFLSDIFKNIILRARGVKNKKSLDMLTDIALDLSKTKEMQLNNIKSRADKTDEIIEKNLEKINSLTKKIISKIFYTVFPDNTKDFVKSNRAIKKSLNAVRYFPLIIESGILGQAMKRIFINHSNLRNQFIRNTINEIKGLDKVHEGWERLKRYSNKIQTERENIKSDINKMLKATFDNIDKDQNKSLTFGIIKADTSDIILKDGIEYFKRLLDNPVFLQNEIDNLELDLRDYKESNYYTTQAYGLAKYMIDGFTNVENLHLNAHNIANLHGVGNAPDHAPIAERKIDKLTSLLALKNMSKKHIENLSSTISNNEDGVMTFAKMHSKNKKESLKENFDGNKMYMTKGHMSEIFDPNTDIKIAPIEDRKKLEQEGYIFKYKTSNNSMDKNTKPYGIYVINNKSVMSPISGAINTLEKKSSGFSLFDKINNKDDYKLWINNIEEIRERNKEIFKQQMDGTYKVPKNSAMIPIYDEKGKLVDMRYVMPEYLKSELMAKRYDGTFVLSSMFANTYDKAAQINHNKKAISLIKHQYNTLYKDNKEDFIVLDGFSKEEEEREKYELLPDELKRELEEFFDDNKIIIHKDILDLAIGFRRLSIANKLKDRIKSGRINKANILFEKILQDTWSLVKPLVVVLEPATVSTNFTSNVMATLAFGVPPLYMHKKIKEAWSNINKYRDDKSELRILEENKSIGNKYSQSRINTLKQMINSNPVRAIVEEGAFQQIVEDVDIHDSDNKNIVSTNLMKLMKYVPKRLRPIVEEMYAVKGSNVRESANKITIYSDFLFRYAQYHWLTKDAAKINKNNSKDLLTHDEAIKKIMETYIDYDVPTSRLLQYTNDIALTPFTKFYMRVQRVYWKLLKSNPSNVALELAFEEIVGNTEDIGDSFFINKSPFSKIRFDFEGEIEELMNPSTVDAVRRMF